MTEAARDDVCAVALAELFRGAGEILASPMGELPQLGARLARATFAPDLLLTDGVATLVASSGAGEVAEGWLPYRAVFDLVWSGRRHVVMGASQLDRFGNQNISCVGHWQRPRAQLLGMRGAPGNTIHHRTSYWVPNHCPRVFVDRVDVVSGVGNDRARELGPAARFHELGAVVTNLAVLDFAGPGGTMRLVSIHPGVSLEEVLDNTGFAVEVAGTPPSTRCPTPQELVLLRQLART
jgi:acyl CoA:acetate/3-ketoacid CoA transferase beta subunit